MGVQQRIQEVSNLLHRVMWPHKMSFGKREEVEEQLKLDSNCNGCE